MITLFAFGPAFGLPDPSPFVMKADVQLKMSGIPYRWERGGPQNAPKGKVPYIDDDGQRIGDSTLIRAHIETKYGVDLDRALSTEQRARAWAIERMLEDHLYFAIVYFRWMIDENFEKGPAHFFDGAPAEIRDAARERTRSNLHGQGIGRHSEAEIAGLAIRSITSLAILLGDNGYMMGDEPSAVDAVAFGTVAAILTPHFDTPLRDAALAHPNLVAYCERMMAQYYPQFEKQAA
ncbi:MAG TPA: glutathione S-transferase family protein [Rhizomicrobium sp.]|nr:glutathione S-transferase family protein [Rhizomicrobium sp.]